MKFENKLQNLRKASNLSQEQLADKLNVSRQAVSKWESGTTMPEMDKLVQMTKIFKCSMDDLVNDEVSDAMIMQNKNMNSKNILDKRYVDSLLEFITKSINMFSSMKFTNLIRCISELCIIFCLLCVFINIVHSSGEPILRGLFPFLYNGIGRILMTIFSSLIDLVAIAFSTVVFFQVYKIRYLDYYDRLIYEYEQKRELEEIDDEKEKENKDVSKKIKVKERKKEHIIIRDPNHRPLAFLSAISKSILFFIKCMVLFCGVWFVFSLIFFIVCAVLSIYLTFYHFLFFGVLLALLATIVINTEILWIVYCFIGEKNYQLQRVFCIFIISIFVMGIGIGIGLLQFKDFKFITVVEKISEKEFHVSMQDSLTITSQEELEFVINNERDDVFVRVNYPADYIDVDFVSNPKYSIVEYDYYQEDFHRILKSILDDLKNNIIRERDYSHPTVVIETNEKNISTLIKNLSRLNYIHRSKTNQGYHVIIDDFVSEHDVCELNEEGLYQCLNIVNQDVCEVQVKNNKIISHHSDCVCKREDQIHYTCYRYYDMEERNE